MTEGLMINEKEWKITGVGEERKKGQKEWAREKGREKKRYTY